MAGRGRSGPGYRRLGDAAESESRAIAVARRTGAKICAQSLSGDDRRSGADPGALSRRVVRADARNVAAAVRRVRGDKRSILSEGRPDTGLVFYGARNNR